MEAFLTSLGLVAVAEIGDKTQLLSFLLAARYPRQPLVIIIGIFLATIANHLFAAWAGEWVGTQINVELLRWILAAVFIGFAGWALIPDTLDEAPTSVSRYGVLLTTIVLFFLAEMGDKTQFATVALGARHADLWMVTLGTTCGMMLANVPAVLLGEKLAQRFALQKMRFVAAALFALTGLGIAIFGLG